MPAAEVGAAAVVQQRGHVHAAVQTDVEADAVRIEPAQQAFALEEDEEQQQSLDELGIVQHPPCTSMPRARRSYTGREDMLDAEFGQVPHKRLAFESLHRDTGTESDQQRQLLLQPGLPLAPAAVPGSPFAVAAGGADDDAAALAAERSRSVVFGSVENFLRIRPGLVAELGHNLIVVLSERYKQLRSYCIVVSKGDLSEQLKQQLKAER
jgi:hypothetical protein